MHQQEIITMVSRIERRLEEAGERLRVRKRLINVVVEMMQNVERHKDDDEIVFEVGKYDEGYWIVSGNGVKNEKVEELKSKLKRIESLDEEGLNEVYRETITKDIDKEEGAGLGLVDIARRSGGRLTWAFVPIGRELTFFWLKVGVS